MLEDLDTSYPRESAERRLLVKPGRLTLDELAERMSRENTAEPVSVRDNNARPVTHSAVYLRGERLRQTPYLSRTGRS